MTELRFLGVLATIGSVIAITVLFTANLLPNTTPMFAWSIGISSIAGLWVGLWMFDVPVRRAFFQRNGQLRKWVNDCFKYALVGYSVGMLTLLIASIQTNQSIIDYSPYALLWLCISALVGALVSPILTALTHWVIWGRNNAFNRSDLGTPRIPQGWTETNVSVQVQERINQANARMEEAMSHFNEIMNQVEQIAPPPQRFSQVSMSVKKAVKKTTKEAKPEPEKPTGRLNAMRN